MPKFWVAFSESKQEQRALAFLSCDRHLQGHGPRRLRAELQALAQEVSEAERADAYGTGAIIEEFEADIAQLLGKPAAVFMPSGTMAQLVALRIHAERASCSTLAFHPTSHLELHEHKAYGALHALKARLVGPADDLLELADLEAIDEPLGALLLELPQREIGGALPSWQALEEQVVWARSRQIAVHLDGARLWEAAPYYQRSLAEISALFDTVYVSFYKTLGAIAGAVLAGPSDLIAEARIWQRRHGGNLVSMYPYLLSARWAVRTRLSRIDSYCQRADRISALLRALPGVRIVPARPQTNMMHVTFPMRADRLLDASAAVAQRHRVALFTRARSERDASCTIEVTIGDAAAEIRDDELSSFFAELCEEADSP